MNELAREFAVLVGRLLAQRWLQQRNQTPGQQAAELEQEESRPRPELASSSAEALGAG